jgi:hypothetical protein
MPHAQQLTLQQQQQQLAMQATFSKVRALVFFPLQKVLT